MKNAYNDMHIAGLAHSVEVTLERELVGGVYGVSLGSIFLANPCSLESTMPRK